MTVVVIIERRDSGKWWPIDVGPFHDALTAKEWVRKHIQPKNRGNYRAVDQDGKVLW